MGMAFLRLQVLTELDQWAGVAMQRLPLFFKKILSGAFSLLGVTSKNYEQSSI